MNETIFYFFYNLAHRSIFSDRVIVFFAVYFPYLVVILAGLFLFQRFSQNSDSQVSGFFYKWREFVMVTFSCVSAYLMAFALKFFLHIPRPILTLPDIQPLFVKTSLSFPSEHATFFMTLALSIFFLHKKTGYWFVFFALLIGLFRIIAGVHFPADILGGFILGGGVAYLGNLLYKKP